MLLLINGLSEVCFFYLISISHRKCLFVSELFWLSKFVSEFVCFKSFEIGVYFILESLWFVKPIQLQNMGINLIGNLVHGITVSYQDFDKLTVIPDMHLVSKIICSKCFEIGYRNFFFFIGFFILESLWSVKPIQLIEFEICS